MASVIGRGGAPPTGIEVAARVAASVFGGYGFTLGFVTFGIAAGVALGVPYGDARTLFHLLAALVFLACLCWAFGARSVTRVWVVLAAGGAVMTGSAWWLIAAAGAPEIAGPFW